MKRENLFRLSVGKDIMNSCYFADFTIGKDAYENIYNVCKLLGKRVLVVGGEKALNASVQKLNRALDRFDIIDIVVYGKECYRERIEELYNTYKDESVDFVMGVGGGKALDTSKCLADMLNVKVVTVPTIASTCAASSALSVVYNKNHVYEGFWYLKSPAFHSFIDTEVIINAPSKYFRAGIGDTIAKYYEVEFSARNSKRTYNDEMGISISRMCSGPLIDCAYKAFCDCKDRKISEEFESAVKIILISTGMVSMLINPKFNGALAHALFYGLTVIDGFEEKFLHGDVIGYTTIVQLVMDNKIEEAKKIYELISSMDVEVSLKARGIKSDRDYLDAVLEATLKDPDMELLPYEVTTDMIYDAIIKVEEMEG